MPTRSKKVRSFDVPINDLSLHVAGSPELYEEVRAAGMSFFERVQSYGVRNKAFASSKRPLTLPEDAPQIAIDMARDAAAAGVGPMYTFRGALVEFVGRTLAAHEHEIFVSSGGHTFVVARKRSRLPVRASGGSAGGSGLAVVVKPELGPHGICSTIGMEEAGLVVVARSCMLAAAAATAARAILARRSLPEVLAYLQAIDGVHGALVVRGEDIGLAGGLELAA